MKRSLLPLVVTAFTFVGTLSGPAEEPKAMVTTVGDGGKSCGTWTELRKSPMKAEYYEGWVGGFLSGVNWVTTVHNKINILGKPVDPDGLFAWVDNYCATNPLNTISQAANALGMELVRRASGPK
jgi:hypothetical protein